jgi:hypothetical protein
LSSVRFKGFLSSMRFIGSAMCSHLHKHGAKCS